MLIANVELPSTNWSCLNQTTWKTSEAAPEARNIK
jgi:hypothetical protein